MATQSQSNIWNIFDNIKHSLSNELDITDTDTDSKADTQANTQTDNIANIIANNSEEDIKCYSCGCVNLVFEEGIIVCGECGIDNGAIIDHDQEWRFYGSEDNKGSDPSRCGMPVNPLLPESSFGTIILGRGYDKFRILNNWNMMSSYKERRLLKVFKYIQNKSNDKDISICVIDRAKIMYKTIDDVSLKRGKSKDGLVAACIYNSCKDKNDIRSPKEISKLLDIKVKKVTTGCKQYNEIMYYNDANYGEKVKPITHEDCIDKFCTTLNIISHKSYILDVANTAYLLGLVSENMPSSIAVSCIFFISQYYDLNVSKKKIADTCSISEVTITKTYKKLLQYKDYLLKDDDLKNKIISGKKSGKKNRKNKEKIEGKIEGKNEKK